MGSLDYRRDRAVGTAAYFVGCNRQQTARPRFAAAFRFPIKLKRWQGHASCLYAPLQWKKGLASAVVLRNSVQERRRADSNRCMEVLQTSPLATWVRRRTKPANTGTNAMQTAIGGP